MFDYNNPLNTQNDQTPVQPTQPTDSSQYYSSYSPQGGYYSTPVQPTQPESAPPTPEGSEPEKKKRPKSAAVYVSGILAACMVSGAAGGGVSYWMLTDKADSDAPVQQAQTEVSTASANNLERADGGSVSGNTISAVAEKASVSVVEITVESTYYNPFFGEGSAEGSGSGVIVTEDGYIVTNNHVIEDAGTITVRMMGGEEYDAMLVGTDSKTDLAVLKVDAEGLQPATFADSDTIQVGEVAVAIGNSLGTLGGTVTDGIISAKDREITIDNQTMTLLQTSAAVNPGNSGGGLFNANGDLIGVVNAKSAGSQIEGLGFAIPSNLVKEVIEDIIDNGYVTGRAQLGISIVEIADEQSARMYRLTEMGVYVVTSENENLLPGDLILNVNGTEIETAEQLTGMLEDIQVGDELTFLVKRNNQETTVSVTVQEQIPEYMRQRIEESSSI